MPLFPPAPMGPKGPPAKGPGLMIALGVGKPKGKMPPMKRPMPMAGDGAPPSALSALSNGPVRPMAPSKKASFRK